MQGKPTVKRFRYIDVEAEQQAQMQKQEQPLYVTMQQYQEVLDTLDIMRKELDKLKSAKPKKAEESEAKK